MRFTLGRLMLVIAAVGLGLGLFRWQPGAAFLYLTAIVAVAVLTEPAPEGGRRPRRRRRRRPNFDTIKRSFTWGVAAPVVCLVFDPLVFRGTAGVQGALLADFREALYTFMVLEMVLMSCWLARRERFGETASGLTCGAFWAGAAYALAIGVALLPFSVLGTLILIGILGFTPFATALSYFFQGRNAWRRAGLTMTTRRRLVLGALGGILAMSVPTAIQLARNGPSPGLAIVGR